MSVIDEDDAFGRLFMKRYRSEWAWSAMLSVI